MTIRTRRLKAWQNGLACDECGREWNEVEDPDWHSGPDDRGYVQLRGSIGKCLVRTTLCPACVEELADALQRSICRLEIVEANRAYLKDAALGVLLGMAPLDIEGEEEVVIHRFNPRNVIPEAVLSGRMIEQKWWNRE